MLEPVRVSTKSHLPRARRPSVGYDRVMEASVAIIGGGASGILVLQQLAERLGGISRTSPKILLVDKGSEFGPGLAYSTPLNAHIINMHAQTMGAVIGDLMHFSRWVASSSPVWVGEEFPPRRVYGQYLKDILAQALRGARVTIECVHDEATNIRPSRGTYQIELASGAMVQSQHVVLALGNFPSPVLEDLWGAKGFLHYPWPVEAIIDHVSGTDPVCVIGSGLSAIDTLHTLLAAGQRDKVYFASRNGLLPKVRGHLGSYEPQFVSLSNIQGLMVKNRQPRIGLDELVDLFFREVEVAEGRPIDRRKAANPEGSTLEILERDLAKSDAGVIPYQAALLATEGIIGRLWNLLSLDDQFRFDREYRNLWSVYRYPMPAKNARRVREVLRSGQLEVLSGIVGIAHDPTAGTFAVELRDRAGTCRILEVPVVINATGQCMDAWKIDSGLLRQMLSDGTAASHPSGGINVDFDTGRVIDRSGLVSDSLFALGELTRGVHFFTNGVVPCALHARDIVEFIAAREAHP